MKGGMGVVSLGPKRELLADIDSNSMVTADDFRGRGPKYANEFNLPPSVWIPGGDGKASRNPFRNGITPYSTPDSDDNSVLFPTSLAARGGSHTGIVHPDGHVYMWGSGGVRLGLGNNVATQSTPKRVPDLENIVAIAMGDDHTLVLKENGRVFAWGVGARGQLGNGSRSDSSTPVEVSVGEMGTEKVVAIAAGNECSFALTDNGRVYGWGLATSGRIGIGTNAPDEVLTPRRVDNLDNIHIVAIAAGRTFSLALSNTGKVYSWGSGSNGKLGNGSTSFKPSPSLISRGEMPNDYVVKTIACGAEHCLALLENGHVYAWGSGENGRLGTGNTDDQNEPVVSIDNTVIAAIACGTDHSIMLSKNTRIMYCTGKGENGRLGQVVDTEDRLNWSMVTSPSLGSFGAIVAVECGSSCTYALRNDGQLFSWGSGSGLVLGSGNETDRLLPGPVFQGNMPSHTLF